GTRWDGHMRIRLSAGRARAGRVRGCHGPGGGGSGGHGPGGGAGGGRARPGCRSDDCGRCAAFRPWRAGWWCGPVTLVLVVILAGSVPTAAGLLAPAAARGGAEAQVAPIVASDSVGAPSVTGYSWPVGSGADQPQVRRAFDPPAQPWLAGHRGVDLAASAGAPVQAAGSGQVVFAGMVAGRPVVSVQHDSGLRSTYEPVQPIVAAGDVVAAGDRLGTLAAEARHCPQPCLHWGARTSEQHYIDPLLLVAAQVVVRLYPLPP